MIRTVILLGMLLGVTGVAWAASRSGWGVPEPIPKPLSIREDSARSAPLGSGRGRTHYFIGGGSHRGK